MPINYNQHRIKIGLYNNIYKTKNIKNNKYNLIKFYKSNHGQNKINIFILIYIGISLSITISNLHVMHMDFDKNIKNGIIPCYKSNVTCK